MNNKYWNDDNPEIEVPVLVRIILSKTVSVKVKDYDIVADEDDNVVNDFSDTNFLAAVEEQKVLPHEASVYVDCRNIKEANDLSGWHVDKIECIKE